MAAFFKRDQAPQLALARPRPFFHLLQAYVDNYLEFSKCVTHVMDTATDVQLTVAHTATNDMYRNEMSAKLRYLTVEHSSLSHTLTPLAQRLTHALSSCQDARAQVASLSSHVSVLQHALTVLGERRSRLQQLVQTLQSAEQGTLVPARPRKNMAPIPKIPDLSVFPDCCREGWAESARVYAKCARVAAKFRGMDKIVGAASTLVEVSVVLDQWRREAHSLGVCGALVRRRSEDGDIQGDGEGRLVLLRGEGGGERERERRRREREEAERQRAREKKEGVAVLFPRLTREIAAYPPLSSAGAGAEGALSSSLASSLVAALPPATVPSWDAVLDTGLLRDDAEQSATSAGATTASPVDALSLRTRRVVSDGVVEVEEGEQEAGVCGSRAADAGAGSGEWLLVEDVRPHAPSLSPLAPLSPLSPGVDSASPSLSPSAAGSPASPLSPQPTDLMDAVTTTTTTTDAASAQRGRTILAHAMPLLARTSSLEMALDALCAFAKRKEGARVLADLRGRVLADLGSKIAQTQTVLDDVRGERERLAALATALREEAVRLYALAVSTRQRLRLLHQAHALVSLALTRSSRAALALSHRLALLLAQLDAHRYRAAVALHVLLGGAKALLESSCVSVPYSAGLGSGLVVGNDVNMGRREVLYDARIADHYTRRADADTDAERVSLNAPAAVARNEKRYSRQCGFSSVQGAVAEAASGILLLTKIWEKWAISGILENPEIAEDSGLWEGSGELRGVAEDASRALSQAVAEAASSGGVDAAEASALASPLLASPPLLASLLLLLPVIPSLSAVPAPANQHMLQLVHRAKALAAVLGAVVKESKQATGVGADAGEAVPEDSAGVEAGDKEAGIGSTPASAFPIDGSAASASPTSPLLPSPVLLRSRASHLLSSLSLSLASHASSSLPLSLPLVFASHAYLIVAADALTANALSSVSAVAAVAGEPSTAAEGGEVSAGAAGETGCERDAYLHQHAAHHVILHVHGHGNGSSDDAGAGAGDAAAHTTASVGTADTPTVSSAQPPQPFVVHTASPRPNSSSGSSSPPDSLFFALPAPLCVRAQGGHCPAIERANRNSMGPAAGRRWVHVAMRGSADAQAHNGAEAQADSPMLIEEPSPLLPPTATALPLPHDHNLSHMASSPFALVSSSPFALLLLSPAPPCRWCAALIAQYSQYRPQTRADIALTRADGAGPGVAAGAAEGIGTGAGDSGATARRVLNAQLSECVLLQCTHQHNAHTLLTHTHAHTHTDTHAHAQVSSPSFSQASAPSFPSPSASSASAWFPSSSTIPQLWLDADAVLAAECGPLTHDNPRYSQTLVLPNAHAGDLRGGDDATVSSGACSYVPAPLLASPPPTQVADVRVRGSAKREAERATDTALDAATADVTAIESTTPNSSSSFSMHALPHIVPYPAPPPSCLTHPPRLLPPVAPLTHQLVLHLHPSAANKVYSSAYVEGFVAALVQVRAHVRAVLGVAGAGGSAGATPALLSALVADSIAFLEGNFARVSPPLAHPAFTPLLERASNIAPRAGTIALNLAGGGGSEDVTELLLSLLAALPPVSPSSPSSGSAAVPWLPLPQPSASAPLLLRIVGSQSDIEALYAAISKHALARRCQASLAIVGAGSTIIPGLTHHVSDIHTALTRLQTQAQPASSFALLHSLLPRAPQPLAVSLPPLLDSRRAFQDVCINAEIEDWLGLVHRHYDLVADVAAQRVASEEHAEQDRRAERVEASALGAGVAPITAPSTAAGAAAASAPDTMGAAVEGAAEAGSSLPTPAPLSRLRSLCTVALATARRTHTHPTPAHAQAHGTMAADEAAGVGAEAIAEEEEDGFVHVGPRGAADTASGDVGNVSDVLSLLSNLAQASAPMVAVMRPDADATIVPVLAPRAPLADASAETADGSDTEATGKNVGKDASQVASSTPPSLPTPSPISQPQPHPPQPQPSPRAHVQGRPAKSLRAAMLLALMSQRADKGRASHKDHAGEAAGRRRSVSVSRSRNAGASVGADAGTSPARSAPAAPLAPRVSAPPRATLPRMPLATLSHVRSTLALMAAVHAQQPVDAPAPAPAPGVEDANVAVISNAVVNIDDNFYKPDADAASTSTSPTPLPAAPSKGKKRKSALASLFANVFGADADAVQRTEASATALDSVPREVRASKGTSPLPPEARRASLVMTLPTAAAAAARPSLSLSAPVLGTPKQPKTKRSGKTGESRNTVHSGNAFSLTDAVSRWQAGEAVDDIVRPHATASSPSVRSVLDQLLPAASTARAAAPGAAATTGTGATSDRRSESASTAPATVSVAAPSVPASTHTPAPTAPSVPSSRTPPTPSLLSSPAAATVTPSAAKSATAGSDSDEEAPAHQYRGTIVSRVPVKLLGHSALLADEDLKDVIRQTPKSARIQAWQCVYTSVKDGTAWDKFCDMLTGTCSSRSSQSSLVILRDRDGAVFGGYNSRSWRRNSNDLGNGECFIFSFAPALTVYRWTGQTNCFLCLQHDGFGWGGGGDMGLWVDRDLYNGTSRRSATYANGCLASKEKFTVYNIEVWTQQRF